MPWWLALLLPVIGIALVPALPLGKVWGDLAFVILFLPAMMWAVAMANPPATMRPVMEWLGNFSLPLYCVHLTVLVWTKELVGSHSLQTAGMALAIALALSWFFSKVVSFGSPPLPQKAVSNS
jgi:peptidoglycan/LPS O-acetylase OafA/YrhL